MFEEAAWCYGMSSVLPAADGSARTFGAEMDAMEELDGAPPRAVLDAAFAEGRDANRDLPALMDTPSEQLGFRQVMRLSRISARCSGALQALGAEMFLQRSARE